MVKEADEHARLPWLVLTDLTRVVGQLEAVPGDRCACGASRVKGPDREADAVTRDRVRSRARNAEK
jgi:hypothetical protein